MCSDVRALRAPLKRTAELSPLPSLSLKTRQAQKPLPAHGRQSLPVTGFSEEEGSSMALICASMD